MIFRLRALVIAASLINWVNNHPLKAEVENNNNEVSLDGLVKIQGVYHQDYQKHEASDIIAHTVAFGLTARVHEWSTARLSLLYEERLPEVLTPLEIDEAFITLGNDTVTPIYLAMGQMYVPFGRFESNLISYPLTYEMALIRAQAVQLGFKSASVYGSIYGFNGNPDDDQNDTIDNYGSNLGFAQETDFHSYDIGIGYINSIGNSFTIAGILPVEPTEYDYVDGLSTHLILNWGNVSLIGEYITALNEFKVNHFAFAGQGAQPQAWNLEAAYRFNLVGKKLTLAAGYQATEEALALNLPQSRILSALSWAIDDNTTLGLEYAIDEDYDLTDGGTGESAKTATLQLAVEF
ncbi:MAG: LbtU family siderophore porin [Thioploca sp.]|nr:LbtU family siderophore porin [Thioploca sp.]